MASQRNAFKAGLFILLTVVLAIGIIVSIQGVGRLTEKRQTRAVAFKVTDDIGGLRVGDEVRVGGYKVGAVTRIEPAALDTADPRLLVTIAIPQRYALRHGARVGVQVTLTGSPSINIESLGAGDPLPEDETLTGRPDPKSALFASLSEAGGDFAGLVKDVRTTTVPKVNAAVDSIRQTGDSATVLAKNVQGKVDPMVGRYNVVADKTGAMMDTVRDFIGPTTTDFKGTMANLNVATGTLRENLPGLLTKLGATVDGASKAIADAQATLANTKDATGTLKSVLGRNEGKLDGAIASLKTTSDNLKGASAEIRRSPWRLLYTPGKGEMNNLNLYDSTRQFAEGANDLNDAAAALRDAIKTGGHTPEELQKLVNKLDATFANFRQVEDKLWAGVKE